MFTFDQPFGDINIKVIKVLYLQKGGAIFEETNCAKLFKDPKSQIFLWNVAYQLGAGPQKSFNDCYPKMGKNKIIQNFERFCLFLFLELEMERNSLKNCLLYFRYKKNRYIHFWRRKKMLNSLWFEILFLAIVLWSKRKVFSNKKKIFIFKVPVNF